MASLSPSPARFYHLKMASLSPFPQKYFDECKFTGTLVSNPLLPSSHERQTRQSNSLGSRRLNRGSCCTPKFSLPFSSKNILLRVSNIQGYSRVDQSNLLLSKGSTTRVLSFSRNIRFKRYQVVSMILHRSSTMLISSFKSCIINFLRQWLR